MHGPTGSGPLKINGLNFKVLPNTLYFLALGCNGAVTVTGTADTSGPIGLIIGEPDFTSFGGVATGNGTNLSTTCSTFSVHGLPTPFNLYGAGRLRRRRNPDGHPQHLGGPVRAQVFAPASGHPGLRQTGACR